MSPLRGPLSRWMSTESRESSDDTQLVTFFNHGRHFPLQPTGGPWFSLLSPLPGTLSSRLSAWLLSLFFKSWLKCAFTVILCLNPIYICNTIPTAAFSNLAWGPPKQSPNKGFHAGSHFKVWSYEQKGRTGHVREARRDGLLKMCDLAGCPHEMTRAPRLVLRNLEKYVPEPSLWGTETRGIYWPSPAHLDTNFLL